MTSAEKRLLAAVRALPKELTTIVSAWSFHPATAHKPAVGEVKEFAAARVALREADEKPEGINGMDIPVKCPRCGATTTHTVTQVAGKPVTFRTLAWCDIVGCPWTGVYSANASVIDCPPSASPYNVMADGPEVML